MIDGVNRWFLIDGHKRGLSVHGTRDEICMIEHLIRVMLVWGRDGTLDEKKQRIRAAVEEALKHMDDVPTKGAEQFACDGTYTFRTSLGRSHQNCAATEGCGLAGCPSVKKCDGKFVEQARQILLQCSQHEGCRLTGCPSVKRDETSICAGLQVTEGKP